MALFGRKKKDVQKPDQPTKKTQKNTAKKQTRYISSMKMNAVAEDAFIGVLRHAIESNDHKNVIDDNGLVYTLGLTNELLENSDIVKTEQLGIFKKCFDLSNKSMFEEGSITNATFMANLMKSTKRDDHDLIAMLPTKPTLDCLQGFDRSIDQSMKYLVMTIPADLSMDNIDEYEESNQINEIVTDGDGNQLLMTLSEFQSFISKRANHSVTDDETDYTQLLLADDDDDILTDEPSDLDMNSIEQVSLDDDILSDSLSDTDLLGDDDLLGESNELLDDENLLTNDPILLDDDLSLNNNNSLETNDFALDSDYSNDVHETTDNLSPMMSEDIDLLMDDSDDNLLKDSSELEFDEFNDPFGTDSDIVSSPQNNDVLNWSPDTNISEPTSIAPVTTVTDNVIEIDIESQLKNQLEPQQFGQEIANGYELSTFIANNPLEEIVKEKVDFAIAEVEKAFAAVHKTHFKVSPTEDQSSELVIQKKIYNDTFEEDYERTKYDLKRQIREEIEAALNGYSSEDGYKNLNSENYELIYNNHLNEDYLKSKTDEMIQTINDQYRHDMEAYIREQIRQAKMQFDATNAPIRDSLIADASHIVRQKQEEEFHNVLVSTILQEQEVHSDDITSRVNNLIETTNERIEQFKHVLERRTESANAELVSIARQEMIEKRYRKESTPAKDDVATESTPQVKAPTAEELELENARRQNLELQEQMIKLMQQLQQTQLDQQKIFNDATPVVSHVEPEVATTDSTDDESTNADKQQNSDIEKEETTTSKAVQQPRSRRRKKSLMNKIRGLFTKK